MTDSFPANGRQHGNAENIDNADARNLIFLSNIKKIRHAGRHKHPSKVNQPPGVVHHWKAALHCWKSIDTQVSILNARTSRQRLFGQTSLRWPLTAAIANRWTGICPGAANRRRRKPLGSKR
ncbi:MAG: hypothetical protein LBI92_04985 [Azoarcus sp.]|nr:hypothetical protein [Azoarcus sp.]